MRLFVAVYPSDQVIQEWTRFQQTAPHWPLRWTPTESLHLTLKFLGEVSPTVEPKIGGVLEKISATLSGFSLSLVGGGAFPQSGNASTFWAGLKGDVALLTEMAHVIELELKTIGFQREKRIFMPHLTVARLADRNLTLSDAFSTDFKNWASRFHSSSFTVNSLALVQSRPGPVGSTYSILRTFPLN